MAGVDRALNVAVVEACAEQMVEGRVVEERDLETSDSPPYELPGVVEHTEGIGAIDMVGAKVFPHRQQLAYAMVEIGCVRGEHGRVDGTGRSAADYLERTRRV